MDDSMNWIARRQHWDNVLSKDFDKLSAAIEDCGSKQKLADWVGISNTQVRQVYHALRKSQGTKVKLTYYRERTNGRGRQEFKGFKEPTGLGYD